MPTPRDILMQNRQDALSLVSHAGATRTKIVLERAERELVARLATLRMTGSSFTSENMKSALVQVREVLRGLQTGMTDVLVDGAGDAAARAAQGALDYLGRADQQFRGVGTQPLALDEASVFEQAKVGARASVLRRLASSGDPRQQGAPKDIHPAKIGILDRYGMNTIGLFEQDLQAGVLGRKSWGEVKGNLIGNSTFLQGKPAFWAERIVRTEMMGAYNRAGWEANREADDQLGDMVKILSATFDDRTGSDSFAVHGQIRAVDEAFMSWFGLYQHPPNRPNDREIVVPHRKSWPIKARWTKEKRKGPPPERPLMTTIDIGEFGRVRPPKVKGEGEAPERRPRVPDDE